LIDNIEEIKLKFLNNSDINNVSSLIDIKSFMKNESSSKNLRNESSSNNLNNEILNDRSVKTIEGQKF